MKHRFLTACCAVLLLLLLASCDRDKSAAPNSGTQAEKTTEAAPGGPSDGADTLADQNRFLCGYEQRSARIGDVLYYTQYGAQDVPMIFAVDLNTMEAFPLCGKPDCEHQDKRCGAYAGGFGDTVQLTAYRGQIYFLDRVLPASILYRVNPDGSGRTEVTRLNRQLEHGEEGYSRSWFGIRGNQVYRCLCGNYVEDSEVSQAMILYTQPLASDSADQAKELLRVDDVSCIAVCLDGDTLYCAAWRHLPTDESQMLLYACDTTGDTVTEVYQGEAPMAQTLSVKDGKLYFGYSVTPFVFSLADGSITSLPPYAVIGDGVLLSPNEGRETCRITDYDGNLLYEGRYYPEDYETVQSRGALHRKSLMLDQMGCSDHIFYYLLEYMQYGSREYGVLAFNADDFTYQILYDVVSPVEENAGGTLTITDDDGTVRVYDTLTGEQISGPPEETEQETGEPEN